MQFFIPHTKKAESEELYNGITEVLKDQLRVQITNRKIFSISYTHEKKDWYAEVGQLEQKGRYEIVAIFEASPYIVFTQTKSGDRGITLLINKDEVTEIQDFE